MGVAAVKSHMKCQKHASISGSAGSSTQAIRSFFVNPQGVSSRSSDTSGSTLPSTSHTSLDTAVVTGDIIRAEVLWTLKVVMCHYSFTSCNDISATFRAMFPDSGIAMTFTCGATKCAYLTCFGLAPYFHEQLVDMVRSTACYSISFDECMNRISQNEQMDFIIRYWDGNTNKVAVRYLGSEFLGHATAVDLSTHFKQGISRLDPKRLLQVSMDGPNVNWKFYTDLTKERNSEELPQLLNIGSCGLHIIHGGLQKGVNESGWKLDHLMRSLWQLFHDTPVRREDFVKPTGSTVFPLTFCPHRWVEDVVMAERAHQLWPNINKYVSSFRATPKKAPQTASYATIKEACEDPLTVTKLEFFISVAKQLQPFLLKFQTDAPMAPFLGQSLKDLDGPLHQERCPGAL